MLTCNFCRKTHKQVKLLVAGPDDVHICDECVELCNDIIAEKAERKSMKLRELLNVLTAYRQRGSTTAAIAAAQDHGVFLVCHTRDYAKDVAKSRKATFVTVAIEDLHNTLRGANRPLVFDHWAVRCILEAAVAAIERVSLAEMVKAFHLKFNHPVREKPAVPSDDELRFRLKLIKEEFFELFRAAYAHDNECCGPTREAAMHRLFLAESQVNNLLDVETEIPFRVDLPEFVDAIADLKYVLEGTNLVCGVDGDAVMVEVQRANMSKETSHVHGKDAFHNKGGVKPVKPPGWQGPDIAGCLKAQGWEG